jgi:hypothetical protein
MRSPGWAVAPLSPYGADQARRPRASCWARVSTISIVLAAACMIHTPLSTSAMAQSAGMAGIGVSDTVSLRATVEALDLNSRVVTLLGEQGNTVTLKVGDEVRNLAQVKVGNKVIVNYHRSVAYVLAPSGTKLPDDSLTVAAARAAPGQMPAGAVGGKLVVTATVVGMDPTAHTLQLVDPTGGLIRRVSVMTPEGQRNMKLIKFGDTIPAIISEAVAIAVEPAT